MTLSPPSSRGLNGVTITDTPSAGEVLTATSATAASWQAATGGLTVLFDSTLGADAASFDSGAGGFSTSHKHLLLSLYVRTSEAVVSSTVIVRFNNDSTGNYAIQAVRGSNAVASAAAATAQTGFSMFVPGDSVQASDFGGFLLLVPNYAGTVGQKTLLTLGGWGEDTLTETLLDSVVGVWKDTTALSRVQVVSGSGNLRTGSRLTIYGI